MHRYTLIVTHLMLSNTDRPLSPIQENDLTTKRIKHTDTDTHDEHNPRHLNKRPARTTSVGNLCLHLSTSAVQEPIHHLLAGHGGITVLVPMRVHRFRVSSIGFHILVRRSSDITGTTHGPELDSLGLAGNGHSGSGITPSSRHSLVVISLWSR